MIKIQGIEGNHTITVYGIKGISTQKVSSMELAILKVKASSCRLVYVSHHIDDDNYEMFFDK